MVFNLCGYYSHTKNRFTGGGCAIMIMRVKRKDREVFWATVFFFVMLFLWFAPTVWGAEARVLTLDDCLRIAEENHPSLKGAEAQIASELGRLDQAAVPDRLKVTGNAAADRSGKVSGESPSYTVGSTASVKVYDANKTLYSVLSQKHTLTAAEESYKNTLLGVQTNVKSAYMTLLLNKQVKEQRQRAVSAFRHHLEQAKGFFEVGTKPKFDVTKAEVDLSNAQLELTQAESDAELARSALLNAMGAPDEGAFEVKPVSWSVSGDIEADAERLALENRSDYKASESKRLAGENALLSAVRASSPTISVSAGYNGGGDDIFSLDTGWSVGLNLSVPLIDGGAAKAGVAIAKGQVKSLEASKETLRQNILLEVRKATLAARTARENIRTTGFTVRQAEENYELASGRYGAGVGNALEVTDALLALTNAHLAAYRASYSLQSAIIDIEKATGVVIK